MQLIYLEDMLLVFYLLTRNNTYMYILLPQGAFLEKIKFENPDVPCFLFGHSTGGAVVLKVRPQNNKLCF